MLQVKFDFGIILIEPCGIPPKKKKEEKQDPS